MRHQIVVAGARLLSVQQASAEFGLSASSIDKLVQTGILRFVEPPHIRRKFLDRRDLERAVDQWKQVVR